MSKLTKKSLSYLLYYAGNSISPLLDYGWGSRAYKPYNWLMVKSADLQGPGSDGPWSEVVIISDEQEAVEDLYRDVGEVEWLRVEDGILKGRIVLDKAEEAININMKVIREDRND